MTDITITEFNPIFDPHPFTLFPAPAGEALTLGQAVRFDTSTGELMKANAGSAAEAQFRGLVTKTVAAGFTANAFKGMAYMDGLDALDYGDKLFLSGSDGGITPDNPAKNEKVTFTITGTPTGGTFTLTFGGEETGNIAFNATAAVVQLALEALATIGSGNVEVTGGALPGAAVVITFINDLGKQNVGAVTYDLTNLTGGAPAATAVVSVAGVEEIVVAEVLPLWDNTTAPTKVLLIQ